MHVYKCMYCVTCWVATAICQNCIYCLHFVIKCAGFEIWYFVSYQKEQCSKRCVLQTEFALNGAALMHCYCFNQDSPKFNTRNIFLMQVAVWHALLPYFNWQEMYWPWLEMCNSDRVLEYSAVTVMIDHENDDRGKKKFWLVIAALWAVPWALIV